LVPDDFPVFVPVFYYCLLSVASPTCKSWQIGFWDLIMRHGAYYKVALGLIGNSGLSGPGFPHQKEF
jgi:hypothetical protein